MYRYRYNGCSMHVMDRLRKHLHKIGEVKSVRGYRYFGRYSVSHEAVMIVGEKGTMRMAGTCWGYGGSGPHAVLYLLEFLGLARDIAEKMAFRARRLDPKLGTDWEIRWEDGQLIQTWIPNNIAA